jgi:hypothetical protein
MHMNYKAELAYIQGTLDISPRARARLAELGIDTPRNRFPQGGEFASFYLPMKMVKDFIHIPGSPMCAGHLCLATELIADGR